MSKTFVIFVIFPKHFLREKAKYICCKNTETISLIPTPVSAATLPSMPKQVHAAILSVLSVLGKY
jgi:hypothetical protein